MFQVTCFSVEYLLFKILQVLVSKRPPDHKFYLKKIYSRRKRNVRMKSKKKYDKMAAIIGINKVKFIRVTVFIFQVLTIPALSAFVSVSISVCFFLIFHRISSFSVAGYEECQSTIIKIHYYWTKMSKISHAGSDGIIKL